MTERLEGSVALRHAGPVRPRVPRRASAGALDRLGRPRPRLRRRPAPGAPCAFDRPQPADVLPPTLPEARTRSLRRDGAPARLRLGLPLRRYGERRRLSLWQLRSDPSLDVMVRPRV